MNSMIGSTGMAGPSGKMGNKAPSGMKVGQLQNFTPAQMQLFQQMFSQVSPESFTSKLAGGDPSMLQQMEQPAMRQFNQLQGNLSSRFSGMGTGGRHTSGFQNEASAAGSNFAQDLQSQRQALQRQAIQDLMGMSNSLLGQRPYEQFLYEKPQSSGSNFLSGALPFVGGAVGGALGGPAGMFLGSQLGGLGSSALQGRQSQGMNLQGYGSLPTSWGSANPSRV